MAEPQFKSVDLFGGAIIADLPSTFEDVRYGLLQQTRSTRSTLTRIFPRSEIRQIPDNQEVYLDREGFSSVVFDILERVEKPNDFEALKFHLGDIVDDDAANTRIYDLKEASLGKASMAGIKVFCLLAISPPGEKMRGRANEPEFVGVLVSLVRLEAKGTDFVVSVNVPHLPGEYQKEDVDVGNGKLGRLLEVGEVVRQRILGSLEVKDWGLFVDE